MNNKLSYLLLLVCNVLILGACRHKPEDKVIISSQTPVSVEETLLSSIISVKRIVPLETTEKSLIGGDYGKILKHGDCFYVSSNRQVLLQFDLNGKFLRQIGAIGSGPGEFAYLSDFDVTDEGVFIVSGNILQYTHAGEYVRTIPMEVEVFGAEMTQDKILGFATRQEKVLYVFDKNGKCISDFQPRTRLMLILSSSYYFPYVEYKYIFFPYLVNNALVYDMQENAFKHVCMTDLPDMLGSETVDKLYEERPNVNLRECGGYIWPSNSNGRQLYFVTHESVDDEGILWLRDLGSGQCSAYDCNHLKNDLTFVPVKNFLSEYTRSDVSFLSYILPADLKDTLKSAKDTSTPYYTQMKALADSLGEENNFVLIEYEFKLE